MPGPAPKPAERRQRRASPGEVTVARGDRVVRIPEPPADLEPRTVEAWESYWASDVAQVVERDSDMPALRRLFQLYDERAKANRGYQKQRLVKGSQGQPVLNPLARIVKDCDSEIRQLEDRFGLNPKARLQLGIQMTEARKGLDSLMEGLDPHAEADDGDDDEAKLQAV